MGTHLYCTDDTHLWTHPCMRTAEPPAGTRLTLLSPGRARPIAGVAAAFIQCCRGCCQYHSGGVLQLSDALRGSCGRPAGHATWRRPTQAAVTEYIVVGAARVAVHGPQAAAGQRSRELVDSSRSACVRRGALGLCCFEPMHAALCVCLTARWRSCIHLRMAHAVASACLVLSL